MPGERMLVATSLLMEGAEVAASSEAGDFPAANLAMPNPLDYWIAPAVIDLSVTVHLDLEPGDGWGFVAPLFANFGTGCTWHVEAAATQEGLSSPTFQTDPVPGQLSTQMAHRSHRWVHSWAWTASQEWQGQGRRTEPWVRVRVTVVDPKLPTGYTGAPYTQWGGLLISDPWLPPYGDPPAHRHRRDESPVVSEVAGGGERVRPRRTRGRATYPLDFLTRAEALARVDELDRRVGESGHVLVCYDPTDLEEGWRETSYGRLAADDREHAGPNVYRRTFTITEAAGW